MIDVISILVGIVFTVAAFIFMIGSAVLVHEKKERQRAGITDYYDQPFDKSKTKYTDGDNT